MWTQPMRTKTKHQSHFARAFFSTLWPSYRKLLRIPIGSSRCMLLFWFVTQITLVLVFRQSFISRSKHHHRYRSKFNRSQLRSQLQFCNFIVDSVESGRPVSPARGSWKKRLTDKLKIVCFIKHIRIKWNKNSTKKFAEISKNEQCHKIHFLQNGHQEPLWGLWHFQTSLISDVVITFCLFKTSINFICFLKPVINSFFCFSSRLFSANSCSMRFLSCSPVSFGNR